MKELNLHDTATQRDHFVKYNQTFELVRIPFSQGRKFPQQR